MMEALYTIEREKGISVEIMLEALANALVTAYKRMPDAAEEALVEIDIETGDIHVIAQELDEEGHVVKEWDDTPNDFGRIAAQTAKQVILQRIREAEREMKYEEYAGREGDIVTGIIQQTDQRYTLLDLGKVEALLPAGRAGPERALRPRQPAQGLHRRGPQDRQGPADRRLPDAPGLVKRLFELEVPELLDGVVELKAVAREPGHRTKIAVASNDPNVDPVGACVGARGARVRHGRQRAARREGRHRSLHRRPGRVRDEGAGAGAGARGAHPPGHRHRRGHRPRLPAVARDRQGRPERAPRGAAHRAGASTSRARRQLAEEESGGGVEYAEGEWVENASGELVWQPAEGGEAISAAEAGYATPISAPRSATAGRPRPRRRGARRSRGRRAPAAAAPAAERTPRRSRDAETADRAERRSGRRRRRRTGRAGGAPRRPDEPRRRPASESDPVRTLRRVSAGAAAPDELVRIARQPRRTAAGRPDASRVGERGCVPTARRASTRRSGGERSSGRCARALDDERDRRLRARLYGAAPQGHTGRHRRWSGKDGRWPPRRSGSTSWPESSASRTRWSSISPTSSRSA